MKIRVIIIRKIGSLNRFGFVGEFVVEEKRGIIDLGGVNYCVGNGSDRAEVFMTDAFTEKQWEHIKGKLQAPKTP